MQRGHAHRLEHAPGESTERHRCVGGSPGGGSHLGDRRAGCLGKDGHRVDRFQLPLGGAHRGRGPAFHEFDGVESLGRGVAQIAGTHVLGEVHDAVGARAEQLGMPVAAQVGTIVGRIRRLGTGHRGGPGHRRLQPMYQRGSAGGGETTRGLRVRHELVQRAVAGDAAGAEHGAGLDLRGSGRRWEEAGRHRVVAGPDSRHVQQRRGGRPTDRRRQQVGVEPCAVGEHDPRQGAAGPFGGGHRPAAAGVHEFHCHARGVEVGGRGVTRLVGAEDNGVRAGTHRPEVEQAADALRQHDAGAVVAGEDIGALDQARRHDEDLGPRLDEAFGAARRSPLDDAQPVVLPAACDRCVGEDLHTGGQGSVGEFGGHGAPSLPAPAKVTADGVLVLHQQHARPGPRGGRGCGQARRPATCHYHVRVGIPLLVAPRRAVGIDDPARGETRQHLLVGGPQPPGPHERLVVEAGAESAATERRERLGIEAQRRPGILG